MDTIVACTICWYLSLCLPFYELIEKQRQYNTRAQAHRSPEMQGGGPQVLPVTGCQVSNMAASSVQAQLSILRAVDIETLELDEPLPEVLDVEEARLLCCAL